MQDPSSAIGSWNFGPAESAVHSVEEVARETIKIWGSGTVTTEANGNQLHEAKLLQLNCDKARNLLQWSPQWDFATTIKETITWYRSKYDGQSAIDISSEQLERYERSAND